LDHPRGRERNAAIPHRRDELPDEPNDTLAKRQNVRVRDVRHEAVRGHE
jgi:hypothetical protein